MFLGQGGVQTKSVLQQDVIEECYQPNVVPGLQHPHWRRFDGFETRHLYSEQWHEK